MKKINLYIAVGLLVLTVAFTIFNTIYIKNLTEDLNNELSLAYDAAADGNFNQSKEYVDSFVKKIKKAESYLHTIIRHDEFDNIKWSAVRLNEYLSPSSIDEFLAENAALQEMVEHLYYNEKIILQNLL